MEQHVECVLMEQKYSPELLAYHSDFYGKMWRLCPTGSYKHIYMCSVSKLFAYVILLNVLKEMTFIPIVKLEPVICQCVYPSPYG